MKFLVIGLMLAGLAGCTNYHARTGGGPSQVPAERGGESGPQGEGNPGNALNPGGDNSHVLQK